MTCLKLAALALLCADALASGGCGGGSGGGDLPSFHHMGEAPAAIQQAARAVVRIHAGASYGTGSFVSPDGRLLTNNHVLGVDVCAREGCYVELSFLHQRGQTPQDPVTVRAVPLAVDVGLDMALLQVIGPDGPLATEDFLSWVDHESADLLGTEVTIVGHPLARLKQWTSGTVIDALGTWFLSTAFILPGDSGSPILDGQGRLVGIVHRGPVTTALLTDRGANVYAIGTASGPLQRALAAPLPSTMRSIAAPTTTASVVADNAIYQNARVGSVTIEGSSVEILSLLGAACDLALAQDDFTSPDELWDVLAPCTDGQRWIECRGDADLPPYVVACPADQTSWAVRYQAMNDRAVKMNGQLALYPLSFGVAALGPDEASGKTLASQSLMRALGATNPVMDFGLANYLAAFAVASYGDTDVIGWLRSYRRQPYYEYYAHAIASAFLWESSNGAVTDDEVVSVLKDLDADPDVDLDAKLYIEDVLHRWQR